MPITKLDQLINAGIIDPKKPVEPDAMLVIGSLTDDEICAVLAVHSKIADPQHRDRFKGHMHMMGF
jgi:hypothetical protein